MTQNSHDVLQILRFQLNYLEQGGFDRDRALLGTESPFQGSFACINFNDPLRAHACHQCLLYQFVAEDKKIEEPPCHHIRLSDSGETVAELIERNDPRRMVIALEQWLTTTIAGLETTPNRNLDS
jgi:hypothetical protein